MWRDCQRKKSMKDMVQEEENKEYGRLAVDRRDGESQRMRQRGECVKEARQRERVTHV